ncbi:MAG TPA: Sec-independent protein translocase subunit TatA [Mycobacterium sp.]
MGALSPWHWAILAIVVILLFGAKRLPDAARSLGKSMRIFKAEVKELQNDTIEPPVTPVPPATTPVQSERVEAPAPDPGHTDARPA